MNYYIALVLLETENLVSKVKTYDETILSIEASSAEEARELAVKYGKSCEANYKNELGEDISIHFRQVIDVNQHLRDEYEDRVLELYSRHFEDLNSYSNFEKLYSKK
ncbi:hypothetical protein RCZ04_10420 [Capnocytophaga sp. HP1101]